MNLEEYKAKIQKISNLLETAKDAEDILNSTEIDLKNDFQYICLKSSINSDLVVDVIARLAQNGNRAIVDENISNISMVIWKDLFNKNKWVKEIFINNFDNIIKNAGIITFRELEGIIDDEDTQDLVLNNLTIIVKKLCTYDRAALISALKTKEQGIQNIKLHMEDFFQKGEYDISTTYSKIVNELGTISEISKEDILKACAKNLKEMLYRETAIDNETNDLLNWIYETMENTKMEEDKRAELQLKIDSAIMENFDIILDKANYDKETIRALKQFPCACSRFQEDKNSFIEKSNNLIHMTKIYEFGNENSQEPLEEDVNEMQCDTPSDLSDLNEYAELIKLCQNDENESSATEIIGVLVKSNIYETDKIIARAINKDDANTAKEPENSNIEAIQTIGVAPIAVKEENGEKPENQILPEIFEKTNPVQENEALIVPYEEFTAISNIIHSIKQIWKKIWRAIRGVNFDKS